MANEIRVTASLQVDNGDFKFSRNFSDTFNQTTIGGGNPGTVSVPTTGVTIDFGDLTSEGWAIMRNLDEDNSVTWGAVTGSGTIMPVGRMEPGDPAGPFRLYPGASLRMEAGTSACKVIIEAMDN